MLQCQICNQQITDLGALQARYGAGYVPPKMCENCRRQTRRYRAKTSVTRELVSAHVVSLDASFIDALVKQEKPFEPRNRKRNSAAYTLGGPKFGDWGGARFTEKHLVHVHCAMHTGAHVLLRVMRKADTESGRSWVYLVIEKTDEIAENTLEFKFTRVYKRTLKGLGRQFDDAYPIEEPHETILRGGSNATSGRFGNEWQLYIREGVEEIEEAA